MDDYPALLEQWVRCKLLWMCVFNEDLRRLIGSGPNQVPLARLVDLILNEWCDDQVDT